MSLKILMDSAMLEAVTRGAECDCFLVGLTTVRRMDLEDVAASGAVAALRGPPLARHYRHVPVIPVPHMKPDGLELVLRPFVGSAEIRVLL